MCIWFAAGRIHSYVDASTDLLYLASYYDMGISYIFVFSLLVFF